MKIKLHEALDRAEKAATQGQVIPVRLCDKDNEVVTTRVGMLTYVDSCIAYGPKDEFFLVSGTDEEGGCDVCHTGNGPRSKENAVLFALSRNNIRKLLDLWEAERLGGHDRNPEDCCYKGCEMCEALKALDISVEMP